MRGAGAVSEPGESTTCWVYRSTRREETYVYLASEDGFDDLPPALREALGALELVMQLELDPTRRLANADARTVLHELAAKRFYLQLPPTRIAASKIRPISGRSF